MKNIKALSLWQPWASAIAVGIKHIETRSWSTNYRGWLGIHAAKTKEGLKDYDEMLYDILTSDAEECVNRFDSGQAKMLPRGSLVAIARLNDCRPTESMTNLTATELFWGNYEPGRYAWLFENIIPVFDGIPMKGAQGLFNIQIDLRMSAKRGYAGEEDL